LDIATLISDCYHFYHHYNQPVLKKHLPMATLKIAAGVGRSACSFTFILQILFHFQRMDTFVINSKCCAKNLEEISCIRQNFERNAYNYVGKQQLRTFPLRLFRIECRTISVIIWKQLGKSVESS
jgi:hypothetical protein